MQNAYYQSDIYIYLMKVKLILTTLYIVGRFKL